MERWEEEEGMEDNSIQHSVGSEENGYPVPDLNTTMINVTKEPAQGHPPKSPQRRNP
jgi:hypothetical protein